MLTLAGFMSLQLHRKASLGIEGGFFYLLPTVLLPIVIVLYHDQLCHLPFSATVQNKTLHSSLPLSALLSTQPS